MSTHTKPEYSSKFAMDYEILTTVPKVSPKVTIVERQTIPLLNALVGGIKILKV